MMSGIRCGVVAVAFALVATGCGCAGSPGRSHDEVGSGSASDANRQAAWGASFSLSDGWTGGANDAGGFEYTDGDIALLVGRHELEPEQSLESFLDARQRALGDPGAPASFERGEQRVASARVLTLRGRAAGDGGGVSLRLLVARLGPREGLSLLLIGDTADESRLEAVWGRLVSTLTLP